MRRLRVPAALLAIALTLLCCATASAADITMAARPIDAVASAGGESETSGGGGILSSALSAVGDFFQEIFVTAINNFLSGIVNAAIHFVDSLMVDLLGAVFHAEGLVNSDTSTVLSASALHGTYTFLYALACALTALKFVTKGFQIYVLWRGGDASESPREMLVGAIQAAIVMVAFPWLYERVVDVCVYMANGIMGQLGVAAFSGGLSEIVFSSGVEWALTLVIMIFALIFFICVFVLWLKLMQEGFELLVMRLGVPLATLGLIDSDMALTKNYFQTMLKTALTVIIQVALMSLAFRVIVTFELSNILVAIALMKTAFSAPKLMQQFLVPQGGGGGMQKAYTAAMVARTAMMLFAA